MPRPLTAFISLMGVLASAPVMAASHPADLVNPLVGTANGGNTYPGATLPFGMLQWSPETTRGQHNRVAVPDGYAYDATRIRGFSLTHLSGAGCAGASGDVPFMPVTVAVNSSPSADIHDTRYASDFSHTHEQARAGHYAVTLANGVQVNLAAALRSGMGQFDYPAGKPANLLVRTSDSESGSSDAAVTIDPATRTVHGWVASGNFCGFHTKVDRHSYYRLYFVAHFDQPFTGHGGWHDATLHPHALTAHGGTSYGEKGFPPNGKGSGAWISFKPGADVHVRVGISYVSLANAKANLRAEIPAGTSLATVAWNARAAWNQALSRIQIKGGSHAQQRTFYTALYHVMLAPNTFSDVNGQYRGFDQKTHTVGGAQKVQYANFSGWDVYRSQIPLLAWLMPKRASDIAQSLYNQAKQNHGEWDRWTHESGATHVMSGDPSAPALAEMVAFGARDFDLQGAYRSLKYAATHVNADDLSDAGCYHVCVGERPSLDAWMKLHYIPKDAPAWGGAGETLEDATADFALAQLAADVGDTTGEKRFLRRSGYWRNIFNPNATAQGGYLQDRNADGSWPKFSPDSGEGFAEGSAAQYLWMVPFDVHGLFDALGGKTRATARLDAFFHHKSGQWALTHAGPLHAELNNEPSVDTPWLYAWSGQPWKTQKAVRIVENILWNDTPSGIPGNDDLGEMSAWYVWAAMGMYPAIPGRAELILGSPLFAHITVQRPGGKLTITAQPNPAGRPYVQSLRVNGRRYDRPWLPATFARHGGSLDYGLGGKPNTSWGSAAKAAAPSFAPPE
ncbi:GH92 family glycosyl hydrolase [Oleiagrimonas sp. C23AA]|uniref:GH92 family glycosyl hydrolase n=1 Tax=Oleiagrimonas sp. C23AA TaxID=2719047 RepID=UPI00141F1E05|nr:GH92 family glycosyl hydrolase [Oleiagrimonas sp. C23AA]NII09933.1 glycoside hydrolase family 92 protein [Oleiagrimonas sp. C23AA]